MLNTNGEMRFGVLAREVFSWDAAIRWIALDDRGRQQLEWRDPNAEVAAAATTPGHPLTVDPLLLMLAGDRHDIYYSGDRADPHTSDCRLATGIRANRHKIGVRPAQHRYWFGGNAYQVGTRLAGLQDSAEDSRVDDHANVSERQREELRVCSAR